MLRKVFDGFRRNTSCKRHVNDVLFLNDKFSRVSDDGIEVGKYAFDRIDPVYRNILNEAFFCEFEARCALVDAFFELLVKVLFVEDGNNLICVLFVHFSCNLVVCHVFYELCFVFSSVRRRISSRSGGEPWSAELDD